MKEEETPFDRPDFDLFKTEKEEIKSQQKAEELVKNVLADLGQIVYAYDLKKTQFIAICNTFVALRYE